MSEKMAFYGSLKRGFYNHKRLELDNQKMLGSTLVSGFALYRDPGLPYPKACYEEGESVHVEVYEVDGGKAWIIRMMEHGAGYHQTLVQTPWGQAIMYIMHKSDGDVKIQNGMWNEH